MQNRIPFAVGVAAILSLLAACGVGLRIFPAKVVQSYAYSVSNVDQEIVLLSVNQNDGSVEPVARQTGWTYGDQIVFLPTASEPSHFIVYRSAQLHLFRLAPDGLPEPAPLESFASTAVDGYRLVLPGTKPGKLFAVEREFGVAEVTRNIDVDLSSGTLTIAGSFTGGRTCPENGFIWRNQFFYLLDHLSHGIGVSAFNSDGSLKSTEESLYSSCSTPPHLCPGGYPSGFIAPHPELPVIYQPSLYHDQVAAIAIAPTTGALTQSQVISTRNKPHALAVSPSGKWLVIGSVFEAGQGGFIQTFAIDPSTGALATSPTYEVDIGITARSLVPGPVANVFYFRNEVDALLALTLDDETGEVSLSNAFDFDVAAPHLPAFFSYAR